MTSNEKKILAVTCFGHFMCHFNMLTFPALVLPLTARYVWDLADVLALSFWMYLLFGFSALPWGLLGDRVGAKPLLGVFYAGTGVCALCASLCMDAPSLLALSLAGVGLFSGIYHPAGLGLISRGVSRVSMGMGYNGMAGNAGLAFAPILAGSINHVMGTPQVYLILGCMNFVGALLIFSMNLDEPGVKVEEKRGPSKTRLAGFSVLCLCMMFGGIAYRGLTVIMPSYFQLRNPEIFQWLKSQLWLPGSENVAATALVSIVFLVGVLGQYLGGRAAEKFEPRFGYLFFHAMALPMAVLMTYTTDIPLMLVAMLYVLFLLGMQPIENSLVASITPERLRHTAFGTKFILTFGVGALSVHLVARVESLWNLPAVFLALAGVSALLVVSILFLIAVTGGFHFKGKDPFPAYVVKSPS